VLNNSAELRFSYCSRPKFVQALKDMSYWALLYSIDEIKGNFYTRPFSFTVHTNCLLNWM
jgi:hypothetical protein